MGYIIFIDFQMDWEKMYRMEREMHNITLQENERLRNLIALHEEKKITTMLDLVETHGKPSRKRRKRLPLRRYDSSPTSPPTSPPPPSSIFSHHHRHL